MLQKHMDECGAQPFGFSILGPALKFWVPYQQFGLRLDVIMQRAQRTMPLWRFSFNFCHGLSFDTLFVLFCLNDWSVIHPCSACSAWLSCPKDLQASASGGPVVLNSRVDSYWIGVWKRMGEDCVLEAHSLFGVPPMCCANMFSKL